MPPAEAEVSAPAPPGLTPAELYFFELYGYLVVPGILTAAQIAELNAAADACSEHLQRRVDAPGYTGGRPAGDVGKLQGEFGRIDTGDLMDWPEPHCQPFRRLLSHRPAVKILLDLVGPGFHLSGANGIFMDKGTEGHTLHGGRMTSRSPDRDAWTYTIDRNGHMECNLITIMCE
jgi:hypothetical protein